MDFGGSVINDGYVKWRGARGWEPSIYTGHCWMLSLESGLASWNIGCIDYATVRSLTSVVVLLSVHMLGMPS